MNYATPQIEEIFMNFEFDCEKAIDYMKGEYAVMKAGRANPKLVENIKVDYYGAMTPIKQMGNISIPEPRQIVISVWDKSTLKAIEKSRDSLSACAAGLRPRRATAESELFLLN